MNTPLVVVSARPKVLIMNTLLRIIVLILLFGGGFMSARAQTVGATPAVSSATEAVNIAKDGVDPHLRDRIVSVYGVGTPAAIQTWWVIFYDPSVPSHGRAVKSG